MRLLPIVFLSLLSVMPANSADLGPDTLQAYNSYITASEDQINLEERSPQTFLHINTRPPAERVAAESRLRKGEVLVDRVEVKNIQGGMIHHWIGTVMIPHATIEQVLGIVHDYNHLTLYYSPNVIGSWLFAHQGNDYRFRMRTREHRVITVVLDVDYDVHDGSPTPGYWYSTSRSTRVVEVQDAGTTKERDLALGEGHGFLCAMNTYWHFVQTSDGVIVQCEAISLSRNIPNGLGWLIGPYVQKIPRESLEFTLTSTRNAVLAQNAALQRR